MTQRDENLDVAGTSQHPEIGCTKGIADKLAQPPLLSSLGAYTAQLDQQQSIDGTIALVALGTLRSRKPPTSSRPSSAQNPSVSLWWAMSRFIWSLTDAGDDPEGILFAKFREGLSKWLHRRGILFAAAWARERQSRGQSAVVHCHLLFHLPLQYRTGAKLRQVESAMYRLIHRHGGTYWDERVIKLVIHDNPGGKYLIKGGGPKVWRHFRLRREHRRLQGIIHGKRCGTTQNLRPAALRRATAKKEKA